MNRICSLHFSIITGMSEIDRRKIIQNYRFFLNFVHIAPISLKFGTWRHNVIVKQPWKFHDVCCIGCWEIPLLISARTENRWFRARFRVPALWLWSADGITLWFGSAIVSSFWWCMTRSKIRIPLCIFRRICVKLVWLRFDPARSQRYFYDVKKFCRTRNLILLFLQTIYPLFPCNYLQKWRST